MHEKRSSVAPGVAAAGPRTHRQELVGEVAAEVAAEVMRQLRACVPDLAPPAHLTPADGELVFVDCSFDRSMDPVYDAVACAAASVGLPAVRARDLKTILTTILRAGAIPHFDVHDWPYLEYADSRPLERQLRERFRFEVDSSRTWADRAY